MSNAELLGCPFCGGEVELREGVCVGDADYIVHKPKIGGTNCGLTFSDFNIDGYIVELWNTRAALHISMEKAR